MGLDVVYPCLAQATSAWPEPSSPEKCQAQASPFSRSGQVFLSFVWAFLITYSGKPITKLQALLFRPSQIGLHSFNHLI